MVGEKFPKGLLIEPIVDGATEVLPREPAAAGGRWEWSKPDGEFVGGRTHNFKLASGGNVQIGVLVTADGTQAIDVPETLIEADHVASEDGRRLTITYRLKS